MAEITSNLTEAQIALIAVGLLAGLFFFHRLIWFVIGGLFVVAVVGTVFPNDAVAGWFGEKALVLLILLIPFGIFSFGLRVMFRGFRRTEHCCHHHCDCGRR